MTPVELEAALKTADSMHPPPLTSSCCIYKVPTKLRTINEEAYTPTVISIGPYHHRDRKLGQMEAFKLWVSNQCLKRNPEKSFDDYYRAVASQEDEIRCCYSETIEMNGDEFTCMILKDACLIIGLFTMDQQLEELSTAKPGITSNLMLDLILLENQIPFFVLERLFQLCSPTSNVSFLEIAFNKFVSIFLGHMYPQIRNKFNFTYFLENHLRLPVGGIPQVQHLCDLLRMFYVPGGKQRGLDTEMKSSYSAWQLEFAGIEFQADEAQSMIEVVCFQGRHLRIPRIRITDWTEIMLRNVVAFEQCHHPFAHYVTDYTILLDCLIKTEKDVEILVDKRIIQNRVANDKVAAMVNKLCHNVTTRNISLRFNNVYGMLNQFWGKPYNKYMATFAREYWSTPEKTISLVFGVILVFYLTLIQTICSMIPLFKK